MQAEFTEGKGNGVAKIVRMHNGLHGFLEHRIMDLDLELSLNIILNMILRWFTRLPYPEKNTKTDTLFSQKKRRNTHVPCVEISQKFKQ